MFENWIIKVQLDTENSSTAPPIVLLQQLHLWCIIICMFHLVVFKNIFVMSLEKTGLKNFLISIPCQNNLMEEKLCSLNKYNPFQPNPALSKDPKYHLEQKSI